MDVLRDKVSIITGATSGIGARIATLFAGEGSTVVIAGRRAVEGQELADLLGDQASFVQTDVADEAQVEALVQHAVQQFGRLDALVNNAGEGGVPPGGLEDIDLDACLRMLQVHAGGVLAGMKYAARVMARQGTGSIINTASTSARLAGWSGTGYSAAKAAVVQLTRCAAIELGPIGIRVNSISPGPIMTGIFAKAAGMEPREADRTAEQLEPAFLEALENHQPLRRAGKPDDVAKVAVWLASDAAGFVNGQDITVDGGITAGRPIQVSQLERRQLTGAFATLVS
jgi:NAD(P)-dependent dehydrogenase (short-subunit alcohol dehydrogenase family)